MNMGHWILVDGKIKEVDLLTWSRWFETAENRRVAETLVDDMHVSTVFLGIDHNFYPYGPPLLFETMIFGGWIDQRYCERYSTLEEAMRGHEHAVAVARREIPYDID